MSLPPTCPLILLAEPRSGSSWLMQTMASHPRITMAGELLNPAAFPAAKTLQQIPAERYHECIDYLERHCPAAENVAWSGCKVLFPHLEQVGAGFADALLERMEERGGHCLFLTRRDLLAARVSQDLARASNRWHVLRGDSFEERTLALDPGTVWAQLDRSWKRRERLHSIVNARNVPTLSLEYEDLFQRPQFWLRRIAAFLDISARGFRPCNEVRGNPRPPGQVLSNYSQVAQRLRLDPRFAPLVTQTARRKDK